MSRNGDLGDADGDLDVLFSNVEFNRGDPRNRLLLNVRRGVFTDGTAARLPTGSYTTIDADFRGPRPLRRPGRRHRGIPAGTGTAPS